MMNSPSCTHCGRPIDLSGDAWRLLPGSRYQHLACPMSPEMKTLPPADSLSPPVSGGASEARGGFPRFLTMDEAADFLRVSKATVRTKIRRRELPAVRLKGGQTVLVEVRDVLALLEPYTGRE